jgi:peptidoglycan/xylan/chitin deacetylase (PgdA/CDA1 family)
MSAPSKSTWPEGTVCAAMVTVNFDAESIDLHEVEKQNLYGRFSYGRYGMRAGVWRLLEVLAGHELRATFFVPALDAENNPAVIEAVLKSGHEIGARGYAYEDHSALGDRQHAVLERAHAALKSIAGRAPTGWRAPRGLLAPDTLALLAELGYVYDSSFQDDDLPYVMRCAQGGEIVELPTFQMLDDSTLYEQRHGHDRVLKTWKEEFDAIYENGLFVNLVLHARGDYGSGRASRARVVDEFLRYMKSRAGVRFFAGDEMARWWREHHPQTEPAPV